MRILTGVAIVYALLFFLNIVFGSYFLVLIQGFVGVLLIVALASKVDSMDEEGEKYRTTTLDLVKLRNEVEELKKKASKA